MGVMYIIPLVISGTLTWPAHVTEVAFVELLEKPGLLVRIMAVEALN